MSKKTIRIVLFLCIALGIYLAWAIWAHIRGDTTIEYRQAAINRAVSTGQSDVIVRTDREPHVSRTGIDFGVRNLSGDTFINAGKYLARFSGGEWQPVTIRNYAPWMSRRIRGRATVGLGITFGGMYGELFNGRYMLIMGYVHQDNPPGSPYDEYLLIEFVVNDDTPTYLP